MKSDLKARNLTILAVAITAMIAVGIATHFFFRPLPGSPEGDLAEADEMAFNNNWLPAAPLYKRAEAGFRGRGNAGKALYAEVSQIPAVMGSQPLPELITKTNRLLSEPGAKASDVRLRVLTVKGMLELEYDAGLAKKTWVQVEQLADRLHDYRLASRASGEQGILAFLLGNVAEATSRVRRAYLTAKVSRDRAAEIRYASLIGRGIVEFGRYQESLTYLNHAITLADSHPEIAKPMMAYESKAEALVGLNRHDEALTLIDHFIDLSRRGNLRENMAEGLSVRAQILQARGDLNGAIESYRRAIAYSRSVVHWHSFIEINASLAKTYERAGRFDEALQAIDAAIEANRKTPDEIYFSPRNLTIKADIEAKMGRRRQAEALYQSGTEILDVLLGHVPTPMMERELISELSDLYSGYFNLLVDAGRLPEGFEVIERAHGRIEAQSLRYDKVQSPREVSASEQTLNRLELQLLDTSDQTLRSELLHQIYYAEQALSPQSLSTFEKPVPLRSFQQALAPNEVALEYVLSDPASSVLTITHDAVHRYQLKSKSAIEEDCKRYERDLQSKRTDLQLPHRLYGELLPIAPELSGHSMVIIIPDGVLNVIPFDALADDKGHYLIAKVNIVNAPSGTVFHLLRTRTRNESAIPYLGVAAWTQTADSRPWVVRAVTGPERSELVPLPESKREIETAASLLPQPTTLLFGSSATRTKFLSLPLSQYEILHLSLHGYADMEFPDRSALVFAPSPKENDSGLLEARDIRRMRLSARLVTLSACNTAAGPIFGSGAATIVNAFIEAGSQSVVSTLWDVDDRSGSKLMSSFYHYLAEGRGRAEALRQAKLEFVDSGQPPYYWANFQMVGDAVDPLFPGGTFASVTKHEQNGVQVQ